MDEIRSLAETLLIYGPFAILALFFVTAFWVTRAALKLTRQRKQSQLFGFALSASLWIVSIALAVLVSSKWPPTIVYQGSMGVHADSTKFFPVSNEMFVNAALRAPVDQKRWHWQYVVVTSHFGESSDSVRFTHVYGDDLNQDYRDYRIRLSDLQSRRRLDFYADPANPAVLLVEKDGERAPYQVFATLGEDADRSSGGWFSAFADETVPAPDLIRWLSSPDPSLRAHAREQLRRMSRDEVEALLDHPDITADAAAQIRTVLGRS